MPLHGPVRALHFDIGDQVGLSYAVPRNCRPIRSRITDRPPSAATTQSAWSRVLTVRPGDGEGEAGLVLLHASNTVTPAYFSVVAQGLECIEQETLGIELLQVDKRR